MQNRFGAEPIQASRSQVLARHHIREIGIAFGVSILVLIAIVIFGSLTGTKIGQLTKDPIALTGGKFYLGLQSNLGILIWWSGAAIAVFSAWFLRQKLATSFLFHLGLFTAFLTLDDKFMFHEEVWPRVTGLGENLLFIVYISWAALIFFLGRKKLTGAPVLGLIVAMIFFALSIGLDQLPASQMQLLFEDGAKFLGQVYWTLFLSQIALYQLRNSR